MVTPRHLVTLLLTAALGLAAVPGLTEATAAPGERALAPEVSVGAQVPTRASARLAGARVTTRVARPARLERRDGDRWSVVRTSKTDRSGAVTFRVPPRAVATTYRIAAPARKVVLRKRLDGTVQRAVVRLRSWTGPARVVPGAPVVPPPAQQPAQQPTQQPTEQPTQAPRTEMIPVRPDGTGSIGAASGEVSADGRWLVFEAGEAIVPEDVNNRWDVYLHDRVTGSTVLVSGGPSGGGASGTSYSARISADGRFVVFQSSADDLVPDDTNQVNDVFLYDRETGVVELVSRTRTEIGSRHSGFPDVSADGRYVVFETMAPNLRPDPTANDTQIVRWDRLTGGLHAISWWDRERAAGGSSSRPSISDDGRFVAFTSEADDLVARDANGTSDVFVMDAETWTLRAVSRAPSRMTAAGPSNSVRISGDGSTIAYSSDAFDLVPDDDNDVTDVFRYDVAERRTTLVSRTPQGRPGNSASYGVDVSQDGRHLAFVSIATDLSPGGRGAQVYLAETGRPLELVSVGPVPGRPGNAGASYPSVSAGGRVVTFRSDSSDLVEGTPGGVNRFYARVRP